MPIDSKLIDVVLTEHDGYPEHLAKEDTRDALMQAADDAGATITEFSDAWWIDPKDWAERARFNKENKIRAFDYIDRFTNQGGGSGIRGTHECTCHSLSRAFEGAYNRQRRISIGPPVPKTKLILPENANPIWVSPLSVYCEANPGQWGGANVKEVLEIAARRGFLPDKIQPREYGFKHTLHGTCGVGNITQSRGPFVRVDNFPDGWEETGNILKPKEFMFPKTFEQAVCMVLHGLFWCVGRDGHAIPVGDVNVEESLLPYWDSYDRVLYDSFSRAKRYVSGSFVIISTHIPDDWAKPAA